MECGEYVTSPGLNSPWNVNVNKLLYISTKKLSCRTVGRMCQNLCRSLREMGRRMSGVLNLEVAPLTTILRMKLDVKGLRPLILRLYLTPDRYSWIVIAAKLFNDKYDTNSISWCSLGVVVENPYVALNSWKSSQAQVYDLCVLGEIAKSASCWTCVLTVATGKGVRELIPCQLLGEDDETCWTENKRVHQKLDLTPLTKT